MNVLALGHIAYLLEMQAQGKTVRILGDPWLSDYVIGDLMGRFPRLRPDWDGFPPVDAVFLSHSHTDHLDPASLIRIWAEMDEAPTLILPQSLRHLGALFTRHLKAPEILFLEDGVAVDFRGLELMAFFNPERAATNEDDVMVFTARGDRDVFLCESDALLPFYDTDVRATLHEMLCSDAVESVCFLTAKNELEATMSMLSAEDAADRAERLSRCLEKDYEEIEEILAPHDDEGVDIWNDARVVRLIGGQGMCFPQALGGDWNHLLFPIRLRDRARMEREIAGQFELPLTIEEFVPGDWHAIEAGTFRRQEGCSFLELLDAEEDRVFRPDLELEDNFPLTPLHDEKRDVVEQKSRAIDCLNHRFLPHLIGARRPPVEHLLARGGGEYRIRLRFGTSAEFEDRDYVLTFEQLRFREAPSTSDEPDEFYWANNLDDFLEGHCDEFSTFCRSPLPGRSQRLWACLGMPYLNQDLVFKKISNVFDKAASGEDLESWVLSYYPAD